VFFFCARSGDGGGVAGTLPRGAAGALAGTAPTQKSVACSGAGSTVREPPPPLLRTRRVLRESGSTNRCTRNCANKGLGLGLGFG